MLRGDTVLLAMAAQVVALALPSLEVRLIVKTFPTRPATPPSARELSEVFALHERRRAPLPVAGKRGSIIPIRHGQSWQGRVL